MNNELYKKARKLIEERKKVDPIKRFYENVERGIIDEDGNFIGNKKKEDKK